MRIEQLRFVHSLSYCLMFLVIFNCSLSFLLRLFCYVFVVHEKWVYKAVRQNASYVYELAHVLVNSLLAYKLAKRHVSFGC